MEVLLLQDVANVGKKNDLLVVGDGFALNYLLPQRLALVATPVVRRRFADSIRKRAEEREREKSAQAGMVQALSGKTVSFVRKVTKTGKLYAAINEKNIADAMKEQLSVSVDEDAIELSEPIKAVGTFTAQVRAGDATQALKVVVQAEKAEAK